MADEVSPATPARWRAGADTGTKGRKSGRAGECVRLVLPCEPRCRSKEIFAVPDYGVSGPTRRYAMIVGVLVALATIPTSILLMIGANWLGVRGPGTTTKLGARNGDPVVVLSPSATPTATPTGGPAVSPSPSASAGSATTNPPPAPVHHSAPLTAHTTPPRVRIRQPQASTPQTGRTTTPPAPPIPTPAPSTPCPKPPTPSPDPTTTREPSPSPTPPSPSPSRPSPSPSTPRPSGTGRPSGRPEHRPVHRHPRPVPVGHKPHHDRDRHCLRDTVWVRRRR